MNQQVIPLHLLCSAPIQALAKSQEITSHMLLKHINTMLNQNDTTYLKMGKFKIPIIDLIQDSIMNIEHAYFEFGINVHKIKNREIFGTYSIMDDNPNIRFKIKIKSEKIHLKKMLQEKTDVHKKEKESQYIT